MCASLIEIGSKTTEKNSAQTNRQTDKQTDRQTNRHYENNGHLAVNQYERITTSSVTSSVTSLATAVQRGNFHVDSQLYSLSPLGAPSVSARGRSRAGERSTRVSIDGVEHVISPVRLDEIRQYDSATPLRSRSSGQYHPLPAEASILVYRWRN